MLVALMENVLSQISEGSRRSYQHTLKDFFAFAEMQYQQNGHLSPYEAVVRYRMAMQERDLAPATINKRLSVLRTTFEVALGLGMVSFEQFVAVKNIKNIPVRGRKLPKRLSLDAVHDGIDSIQSLRDKVAMLLMVGLGLRRSEVVGLTWEQLVEWEGTWVLKDIQGKGHKVRSVAVPDRLLNLMLSYRGTRREGSMFELSDRHLWNLSQAYFGVAPHDLRRTFAKLAREGGSSLSDLANVLGHASEHTTQRYIGDDVVLVGDRSPVNLTGIV